MAKIRLIIHCPQPLREKLLLDHLQIDLQAQITDKAPQQDFFLKMDVDLQTLFLQKRDSKGLGICVDFIGDKKSYDLQKISFKKDLLARAIGVEKGLRVFDMTLGLASDSFKLAYFGADVFACEQNEMIWALTENAIWRWKQKEKELSLKVQRASSVDIVEQSVDNFSVFYLDPMYSHPRKALPKKEMQYLAEILPIHDDNYFANAIDTIFRHQKKLVVKRAVQSDFFLDLKPRRSVTGKMVRFDIYS